MAASLPVVISSHALAPTCPYTACGTLGRKCVRVAYCWGTSAYPNVSSMLHPRQSTHVCRGQLLLTGKHHLSGLRGNCLPTECIYMPKACSNSKPIAQGMQSPFALVHHPPAPPFTHSLCAVEPIRHPTRPTRPGSPPSRTCKRTDRLEKKVLGSTSGSLMVFAMVRTPLQR
ncbi:hypothetical protein GWK47_021569 [Chionoecetes opilio]|uniref:Uncharacterized protein n=1 Tax=Chionoecetes opilio TaxID=41210 RepID=A0A8J4XNM3_CHIOP|nr:hypothetical protein GWK47_021569 [Chionoecetes opilio]